MIFILSKADPFSYSVWRLLPSEEAPPFLNRENGIQTLHPVDRTLTSWSLQVLPERVLELFQPVQQERELESPP